MNRYDCTLWEFLKDDSKYDMDVAERVDLSIEILKVVIFIHQMNFFHRDLKPSNIFLKTKVLQNQKLGLDQWVLGDFGLSSLSSDLAGSSGTAGFVSMEQFEGKPTQKSDNYSFGKMAVLILFKWNIGWTLLARPLSNLEYKNFQFYHLFNYLSKLVQVRSEKIFFQYLGVWK